MALAAGDLKRYAIRYEHVRNEFCGGDIADCDWDGVRSHWEDNQDASWRAMHCKAADSACYVQRHSSVFSDLCGNSIANCDWQKIVEEYWNVGRHEGRKWGCLSTLETGRCAWAEPSQPCYFACAMTNIRSGCKDNWFDRIADG